MNEKVEKSDHFETGILRLYNLKNKKSIYIVM